MRNTLKNSYALSTVVTTLIILVVSVLLAGVVTYFAINVTSVGMQQESLQIEKVHVWVPTESNWPEAAFLIVNQGGRDVALNKITIRGQTVAFDRVSYAVTDKSVSADLDYIPSLDSGGSIITIDESLGDSIALVQATNGLILPSGKSMLVYINNPSSITVGDIGLTVSVAVFTSMTLYYKETNVECYSDSLDDSPGLVVSSNLRVYSDSACTQPLTTINWGSISPGGTTAQIMYIKNIETVAAVTLNMTTSNWNPKESNGPIIVTWDREGTILSPGQSIEAIITLAVSPDISNIVNFTVQISIAGTQ